MTLGHTTMTNPIYYSIGEKVRPRLLSNTNLGHKNLGQINVLGGVVTPRSKISLKKD